jgi:hypothetical protein
MMARLLAEIKAEIRSNKAKTDANLKEMRASQELLKQKNVAKMENNQEEMEAKEKG